MQTCNWLLLCCSGQAIQINALKSMLYLDSSAVYLCSSAQFKGNPAARSCFSDTMLHRTQSSHVNVAKNGHPEQSQGMAVTVLSNRPSPWPVLQDSWEEQHKMHFIH